MRKAICLLVAAITMLLALQGTSFAALKPKPSVDAINDIVAVMRTSYRKIVDAEYNLESCRAGRALTQKQLNTETALVESARKRGDTAAADLYQTRVTRLTRQIARLNAFDYETLYKKQITDNQALIKKFEVELQVHITEYQAMFGKKAEVDLDFKTEMDAYKSRGSREPFFLQLD